MGTPDLDAAVDAVRAFNRFYTRVIGVLEEGLLDTPYSLTEARVIFELAQRPTTDVSSLRHALELDPGYLSRILARFESDGLVARGRSDSDGRRQVVSLTDNGRSTFDLLDQRSRDENRGLIHDLRGDDRRRLLAAMETIEEVLARRAPNSSLVLRSPLPGDYGWVIARHGALYADEFGWNEQFEGLVARIVADYLDHHDAKRENAWIAELGGEPVGCVFCVRREETVAQLRILLVEPWARGMGLGSRLVDECISFARGAGYATLTLWTNDVLAAARRIYERAGFRLVEEERHESFGHALVGQNWSLDL